LYLNSCFKNCFININIYFLITFRIPGNKGYPGLDAPYGAKGQKGSPGIVGPTGIPVIKLSIIIGFEIIE